MTVHVFLDHRFIKDKNGRYYAHNSWGYGFWTRYLRVFDEVCVVARVQAVDEVAPGYIRADGPRVRFYEVPYFVGMVQYAPRYFAVDAAIRRLIYSLEGPAILRISSSAVSNHAFKYLRRRGLPFGAEVIADPWDTMSPGTTRNPLRPFLRVFMTEKLRKQCRHASAVAYVTEGALQRRYPAGPGAFSTHYSSIDLHEEAFREQPRDAASFAHRPLRLINVGTMGKILYKGQDLLLRALAELVEEDLDLELTLVGGGENQGLFEKMAARLGVAGRVVFTGKVKPGQEVREQLDRADIFAMPSRQEGLPRAMIEAMARGLPCVGSTVGGIPELLPAAFLFPPNDVAALKEAIRRCGADPGDMARQSARNLDVSRGYANELLTERRIQMYQALKEAFGQHAQPRRNVEKSTVDG